MRFTDYSPNTEKSYLGWINRFLVFHHRKCPFDCAETQVASFLEYLAVKRKVSGSTQGQALNALVFFWVCHEGLSLGNQVEKRGQIYSGSREELALRVDYVKNVEVTV